MNRFALFRFLLLCWSLQGQPILVWKKNTLVCGQKKTSKCGPARQKIREERVIVGGLVGYFCLNLFPGLSVGCCWTVKIQYYEDNPEWLVHRKSENLKSIQTCRCVE